MISSVNSFLDISLLHIPILSYISLIRFESSHAIGAIIVCALASATFGAFKLSVFLARTTHHPLPRAGVARPRARSDVVVLVVLVLVAVRDDDLRWGKLDNQIWLCWL